MSSYDTIRFIVIRSVKRFLTCSKSELFSEPISISKYN